jgi:hypothetical protein
MAQRTLPYQSKPVFDGDVGPAAFSPSAELDQLLAASAARLRKAARSEVNPGLKALLRGRARERYEIVATYRQERSANVGHRARLYEELIADDAALIGRRLDG